MDFNQSLIALSALGQETRLEVFRLLIRAGHKGMQAGDISELSFLMGLAGVEGFDHLRNKPWPPQNNPSIEPSQPMFATISEQALLLPATRAR